MLKPAPRSGQRSYIMQTHLLEHALKVIVSPQILVNVISKRVRQLTAGHRPAVEVLPKMGFADIALAEVIQGKLTYEHTTGLIPQVVFPRISTASEFPLEKRAA